eukprot:TRINITY_DN9279_c0_g1_i1.p1 TRINITY_DN9279_c0_g1~~TRINITY_DN9279_c0_g1_i1.p1  ORF type:complete len:762 (-),score=260.28 TRINITY_DN9279_c0_g1_i1:124-2274(-)
MMEEKREDEIELIVYSLEIEKSDEGYYVLSKEFYAVPPFQCHSIEMKRDFQLSLRYLSRLKLNSMDLDLLNEFQHFFLGKVLKEEELTRHFGSHFNFFVPKFHKISNFFNKENDVKMEFSMEDLNQRIKMIPLFMQKRQAKEIIRELDSKFEKNSSIWKENMRREFNGKLIVTPYNSLSYWIRDVKFSLSPQSTFSKKGPNGNPMTFLDYYTNKLKLQVEDLNQPLFAHGNSPFCVLDRSSPSYLNLSEEERKKVEEEYEINDNASQEKKENVLLLPEFCWVYEITSSMKSIGFLLPSFWFQLSSFMKLKKFEDKLGFQLSDPHLLKLVFTHPTFSANDNSMVSNYQRLEFVGDAVVYFMVLERIYRLFPDASEGKLSDLKTLLVSNTFLSNLGSHLNLKEFMLFGESNPNVAPKAMADALEALMGAIFLDQGFDYACAVFNHALFHTLEEESRKDNSLYSFWIHSSVLKKEKRAPQNEEFEMEEEEVWKELWSEIEERIGFSFKNRELLIQALTHPSYRKGRAYNYERIELLGDCVLQLIVTVYLYHEFPNAPEGQMSPARASIVCNRNLTLVIQSLGLDQYLRHNHPHLTYLGPKFYKACADIFESLLGALFIEQGIEACTLFVEKHLLSKVGRDVLTSIHDPKGKLQQIIQTVRPVLPTYRVLNRIQCQFGTIYETAIFLEEELLGRGFGLTTRESEEKAAENSIIAFNQSWC